MKVSQAKFARIYSISRETFTKWKAKGKPAVSGKFRDLEKTQVCLARSATSRTKSVAPAVLEARQALPMTAVDKADDALMLRPRDEAVVELTQDGLYSVG